MTFYESQSKFILAIDCIIFGFDQEELKLLLIKRDFEPEKGKWSLMGGFLNNEETLTDTANRVLFELTGLNDIYLEQLSAFSHPLRDPVERTISVAYFALINIPEHKIDLTQSSSPTWFSINDLPYLIFDHNDMVQNAIRRLRYRTSIEPVGIELLPAKFTMRQMQKLYETIYGEDIDKRNFTKKILALDILTKLEEKDKGSSRKGSWLYEFDPEKYDKKVKEGFNFKI